MLYRIYRASDGSGGKSEISPCEDSFQYEFKNKYTGRKELYWCIELNTLEDINNFIKKYGKIVIEDGVVTIYDDYIE